MMLMEGLIDRLEGSAGGWKSLGNPWALTSLRGYISTRFVDLESGARFPL